MKMIAFYRPPNQIEGEGQGKMYLEELADTFARMRPTWDEWDHVWQDFKRTWTKGYWPTFADLPDRLSQFRAQRASVARAAGLVERMAEASAAEPYNNAKFLAAYQKERDRMNDRDPQVARWGVMLVRLGNALLRRRDHRDQPRPMPD